MASEPIVAVIKRAMALGAHDSVVLRINESCVAKAVAGAIC
jgi:hypothetical protein